jgi:uncharacterized protein
LGHLVYFGLVLGWSWLIQLGAFGEELAGNVDSKQLGVAFLGYLTFSLYMTVGAMETHKVLFFIFVLIDFLFIGLALSTFDNMHEQSHMLAAFSELCIALLPFYGSAATVLNTHFGQILLPLGKPFGIFKKHS